MSATAPGLVPRAIAASVLAMAFLSVWASSARSDEPAKAFRRVLVPAENPAAWPREGRSLLPVESKEFESWLELIDEPPPSASIVESEYHARVASGELVEARGQWRVELRGKRAARLSLDDASLSMRVAKWRGRDAALARLGWWPEEDGESLVRALEVPASGVLDFEWTADVELAADAFRIPLDFPAAAQTKLVLELPAGMRPVIESGAIVESPNSIERGGRWVIALATAKPQVLHIERADGGEQPSSSTVARQLARYAIHRGGLDLETTFDLSSRDALPTSIVVAIPAGLSVVAAESADRSLSWRVVSQGAGGTQRLAIEIPEARQRHAETVIVRAWGPLVVDAAQRLPMPTIRDVFWTSGEIELIVDESLQLQQIAPSDCIETAVEVAEPTQQSARKVRFTAFAPQAALDVSVRQRPASGVVQSGVSLSLGNSEIAGQIVSQIHVERGRLHQLAAELQPKWVIDAVETIPADILGEWYVDRSTEPQVLRVQLDRAIASETPVRIVVRVHSSDAGSESISVAALNPLRWRRLRSETNVLELLPAEQYDLDAKGAWAEVTLNQLPAEQRALVSGTDGARFALVDRRTEASIRLVPKRIAYEATVQIAATLRGERCELEYDVVCSPQGGAIDHALLFFGQPPAARVQWVDADSQQPLRMEKMPASDPRFGGLPAGGELWRLDFGRLYARAIRVSARQSIPWVGRQNVSLVSLPDAASQLGRITVADEGGPPPIIATRNMAPAPLPLATRASMPASGTPTEMRGAYRFQPTRLYDAAAAPQLWIAPPQGAGDLQPIITNVDLESRYAIDGSGVHRAVYRLSSHGATTFDLRLPERVSIASVRLDGAAAPVERGERLALRLPPRKAEAIVELEFTSRGPSLANGATLASPLPSSSSALIAGAWRVELPQGFAAFADSDTMEDGWCARLFGPLARQSSRPFDPFDVGDWNRLWVAASSLAVSPAQAATDPEAATSSMPKGTATYHFLFGTAPLRFVTVAHRPATNAVALAVFLLCAVGSQLIRLRLPTRLWLALSAAAVSLLLPTAWAPLATGANLGFVAAAIWQWMQPRGATRTAAFALVVAIGLAPAGALAGPRPTSIESVLVPVDAEGRPVGTKYYVSADFLRQLLVRSEAVAKPGHWVITDMRCDGQLPSKTARDGSTTSVWKLNLEIVTLVRDVTLTLPLVRAEARWPVAASLDGIPAPIAWSEAGRDCTIRVPEPGPHRVSVSFEPHRDATESRRGIALQLPPISGAKISIVGPREIGDLSSVETQFARRDELQQSVWQGDLHPSGNLTLSWSSSRAGSIGESAQQITQVSRLVLSRPKVVLDVHLVRQGDGRWPETIQIAAESAWQLSANETLEAESVGELSDGGRLLEVRIPPAERRKPQLSLQFVSPQTSPLGYLRPPGVALTSPSLERRWLAVSCDSSLECIPSAASALNAGASSESALPFDIDGGPRPNYVVDMDQIDKDWHLSVRPAARSSTFRDRLSIAAGKDRVRVNYRSNVSPQGADRFGGSLSVPVELSIDDVSATENGEIIPLEWVRAAPGRVNVFFDRPITGAYQLELRGELPMPEDGQLSLPRIASLDQLDSSQIVALYRDDNVTADWQFPEEVPWVESGASLAAPFGHETHFVRAFPVDATTAAGVHVAIDPGDPALSGETLTQVVRDETTWGAVWQCDLRVDRGTVDVVRLALPDVCSGPFEVTTAANVHFAESAAANEEATLTLRLSRPAGADDTIRLVVRSPLAISEGQLVSAPRVRLLANGKRREYLSLPAELDGERLAWTRSGIEPSKLPTTLQAADSPSEAIVTYRVSDKEINATLRPQPQRADLASVRLAETATFVGEGGRNLQVTRFLLSPAGLDHCEVRIPDGQSLVRLSVNGHSALQRVLEPRCVQLQLEHTTLPQMIDVVLQSDSVPRQSEQLELIWPKLEQSGRAISVDLSLWTLHGRLWGRHAKALGGTPASPATLASLRLDLLTSISQSATRTALEVPAVDGYSWFVHWASELRAAGKIAERAAQTSTDASLPTRVKQSDDNPTDDGATQALLWIEQMAEFFRASELPLSEVEQATRADLRFAAFDADLDGDVRCFVSDGGRGSLLVAMETESLTSTESRYCVLGSLALMAAVVAWLARKPRAVEFVDGWPEIPWLLIGLAAWAWLRPSLVGLAIAAISLGLLLRRVYQEKKSPRHGSSQQPTSIPEEQA